MPVSSATASLLSLPAPMEALSTPGERLTLWRLHGAHDALDCIAVQTSYGFALALELGGEQILLELQPNSERLAGKAARLESWLREQGWTDERAA